MKELKRKRIIYLGTGTVLLLLMGLIYAWSVFIAPLEAEFGWDRAETSMTFTLSIIFFCLGGILGGVISQKSSVRVTLILSAISLLIGFLLSSNVNLLGSIYVSYGILVGLGVGLAYNAIINSVTKWYPDRKGFRSGTLLMGFGLGSLILGSLVTSLMSDIGWRQVFVGIAIVFSLLILLGSFILRTPKKEELEKLIGDNSMKAQASDNSMTPRQMLKTKSFWTYFIWSLALIASGLIIIGHAAAAASDIGAKEASAALIMGLVSIANGLGRIIFGICYDKLALKKTMLLITLCAIIAPACLILSNISSSLVVLSIGFLLTGAFYGGVPTMNSTFAGSYYGMKNFAVNFPIVNSTLLIAPIIGSYLAGYLRASTGSYMSSFIIMLGFAAVSIITWLLLKDNTKKEST